MELTHTKIGALESVDDVIPDVLLEDRAFVRALLARQSAELAAYRHAMREGVLVQELDSAEFTDHVTGLKAVRVVAYGWQMPKGTLPEARSRRDPAPVQL